MSDTATTEQTEAVATEAEAPAKAPKADPTKPCFCSFFEVGNFDAEKVGTADEEVFTTGCTQTTKRQFAQGHDARLVSFLVDGHFDGYSLRSVINGVARTFSTPADAAVTASDALGEKAKKATANRATKQAAAATKKADREKAKADKAAATEQAKADKAAAKEKAAAEKAAEKANKPQAEVHAGSQEGDVPAGPEGTTKIKVGRWEYDAVIDEATGVASFTDGKGEAQTIERDGYRLLVPAV